MPAQVGNEPIKPIEPPPPPPPKKVEAAPQQDLVVQQPNAFGFDTKIGDAANYAALRRSELENKSFVDDAVAGSTGHGTFTRPVTSTAESLGFSPRTPEAAKAARVLSDTINAEIAAGRLPNKYGAQNQAIGAAIHQDGSVTLTASGDGTTTEGLYNEKLYQRPPQETTTQQGETTKTLTSEESKPQTDEAKRQRQNLTPEEKAAQRLERRKAQSQERVAQNTEREVREAEAKQLQKTIDEAPTLRERVQQNLNEAFKNDPNVKRNTNGDVDFNWGNSSSDLKPRIASQRDGDGTIKQMSRTADNCAAGKMYHADNANSGKNPVIGADEVWRTDPKANNYQDGIRTNNTDGRSMSPCESCSTNADKVTGGNATTAPLTRGQAVRSGATGAGVAATVSTLEQLWNTGTVDANKLASDTTLGAVTSVAGEGIERAVTPGITNAANRALYQFANSGTNAAITSGVTTAETRALSSTAGRLGGAGAAGAIVGAGMEVYNQRENFLDAEKRPDAVGAVAGQAAVGFAAGVAGAYAGAAIGSFIPIPGVGTVVGAAVGFGVGYLASELGVDKAIASGVSTAYRAAEDFVSGAANKLASVFGW